MSRTPQPRYGTTTLYRVRRRRELLGALLALVLAATAFAGGLRELPDVLGSRGGSNRNRDTCDQ
jgi:hypothetical protein